MDACKVLQIVRLLFLAAILIPVSVRDIRQRVISNRSVVILAAGGTILAFTEAFLPYLMAAPAAPAGITRPVRTVEWSVLSASAAGLLLGLTLGLLCRLAAREGLGGGDFKLMAALGLTLGLVPFLEAMAVAGLLSFLTAVFLLITKKRSREDFLPFAPFLTAGVLVVQVAALAGSAK